MAIQSVPRRFAYFGSASKMYVPTLIAAWLGECFDAMDATIYFIALYPALSELMKTKDAVAIGWQSSIILFSFMLGWAIGSVLFGVVADKFGRKNTLAGTILLYAAVSGLCAFVQNPMQLAICRFLVGLGIGGEISLGGIMLGEVSTRGKQRALSMALLGTSFGVGCLLCGLFNFGTAEFGWRYLFAIGMIPAVIVFLIRRKLDEPACFEELQARRKLLSQTDPKLHTDGDKELLANPLRLSFNQHNKYGTIIVTILASSAIVGYWAGISWLPAWINQLTGTEAVAERSTATICMSLGGFAGAMMFPYLYSRFTFRQQFKIGFLGSLLTAVVMFGVITEYSPLVNVCAFCVGVATYLPFLTLSVYLVDEFRTNVRATVSGIAWSFGRIVAGIIGLATAPLIAAFGGCYAAAGAMVSLIYLLGWGAAYFLREPRAEDAAETAASKPGKLAVSIR